MKGLPLTRQKKARCSGLAKGSMYALSIPAAVITSSSRIHGSGRRYRWIRRAGHAALRWSGSFEQRPESRVARLRKQRMVSAKFNL